MFVVYSEEPLKSGGRPQLLSLVLCVKTLLAFSSDVWLDLHSVEDLVGLGGAFPDPWNGVDGQKFPCTLHFHFRNGPPSLMAPPPPTFFI